MSDKPGGIKSTRKHKRKPAKKKEPELPHDALVLWKNPDKVEAYQLGDAPWMPFNTTRVLLSGVPGVGKSSVIRNILERVKPRFTSIHLVHLDSEGQHEYDYLFGLCPNVYIYGPKEIPSLANIDDPDGELDNDGDDNEDDTNESSTSSSGGRSPKAERPCLILDEITSDVLTPEGRTRLERHLGFTATHRSCPIFMSIQNLMAVQPKCRRLFDWYCLWRGPDREAHRVAASKAGIDLSLLDGLFSLCKTRYDFITTDCSRPPDDPYRYRLNLIEPIEVQRSSND